MKYLLDRRVTLSTDSKYASLYSWSISEEPVDGKLGAENQIPWDWSLSFHGTDVTLSDAVEADRFFLKSSSKQLTIAHNRFILVKLNPDGEGKKFWGATRYSFFGTDREISDFTLKITESDGDEGDEEGVERCNIWGSPSYDSEGSDFRTETTADCLFFTLAVKPETFSRLATQISMSTLSSLRFRIGGVPGFYSSWSPTIETNHIKILSPMNDHQVEIPEGCEIEPPRLGQPKDFLLLFNSARDLRPAADKTDRCNDRSSDVPEERQGPEPTSTSSVTVGTNNLLGRELRQLRIAAWLIVVLLVVHLVRFGW